MDYLKDLQSYRDREIEVLRRMNLQDVNIVMNVLEEARVSGKHIFICGNGGSAATASHYACDFNKGVNLGLLESGGQQTGTAVTTAQAGKPPLYNFECLSDNLPTLMAISNDESYSEAFRFPLSVKMKEGDIVIGISGSGNSANVIKAFEYAGENGGTRIAIVGFSGGRMKEMADYCIHINVDDMQIAEDLHMVLDHMMMWVLNRNREH